MPPIVYNFVRLASRWCFKMRYGYVRVSSKQQNIDRQLEEIKKYVQNPRHIYVDKESGKDFNRSNYQKLIKKLKEGDLLIIKSIDRLGRNYQMILDEWRKITKTIHADILVIDMPLLDTRDDEKNLVGRFIGDIVLQILSFVAENERKNIRQRQAEGIRIAKEKGIRFGRPKKELPDNYKEILFCYEHRYLTLYECLEVLKVSKGTFYRLLKQYRLEQVGIGNREEQT